MQADINNYLFESPSDLEKKRRLGIFAVNGILTISLIGSMGFWFNLSVRANDSEGIWAMIGFSLILIGLATEVVRKITLSIFRNKKIWAITTGISLITFMATLSIVDNEKQLGAIKESSAYKIAVLQESQALKDINKTSWASSFKLAKLEQENLKTVQDRNKRLISYPEYIEKKKAIKEKVEAKRLYDSAVNRSTKATEIINSGGDLSTATNPALFYVSVITTINTALLKTALYLTVVLILEYSAWWIGGEVEKINKFLKMSKIDYLNMQNIETFGTTINNEKAISARVTDSSLLSDNSVDKAELSVAVGQEMECLNCRKKVIKKHYMQKFCSHSRSPRDDGGNCSDDHNNKVNKND